MKASERELDQMIRDALGYDETEVFERIGELSIHEQMLETFRGRNRWLAVLSFVATLAFFVLAIYAVVQFLRADAVREIMSWFGIAAFAIAAVLANKIWYWGELNRQATQRELKRLELQIAQLARDVREGGEE
jgi:hypothetical protein